MDDTKLTILCPYEMLYDMDYGLLKVIVDKYNNPAYINTDYLKHVSFEQLKEDLKYQETRDPLKLAFKEGIHYKHFYKLLYDNEMETIVKNCIRLKTHDVFQIWYQAGMANINIVCKNEYQSNRIKSETNFNVINEEQANTFNFDCLYVREYQTILNDYVEIKNKNIYIANCNYNLDFSLGLPNCPNKQLSPYSINNEINLIDIY